MSNIARIAAALGGVPHIPLTPRQVRDSADDLISHDLIRPGRPGHAAEIRDAREGALILLSALGASSARGAGRFGKRLRNLNWVHGSQIDPAGFAQRESTKDAVAFFVRALGQREFLQTQVDLLERFRQMRGALDALQAEALELNLNDEKPWQGILTVELHTSERLIAEITVSLVAQPEKTGIEFSDQAHSRRVLYELKAVFADEAPIIDPSRAAETRRFDDRVIEALGSALAG